MKNRIRIICLLCLIIFLLSGCKGSVDIETSEVSISTNDLLKTAPLVFLGQVVQEHEGHYRNQTTIHKDANGNPMYNYWVTPYTIRILEVYKGSLSENINELTLSTLNFYSNDDMAEDNITAETFYLTEGSKMVFCARYEAADDSYIPLYDHKGCFGADGKSTRIYRSGSNTLDITQMTAILQTAQTYGSDLLKDSGINATLKPEHIQK